VRDQDKLREKIELSLDNRQVVSLVIGSLVVLGVVFVLGVMVGKGLAPAGKGAPQDLLGTLDRAGVPDAGPQLALTFQKELTQPAPPVPPPPLDAHAAKPVEKQAPKVDVHPPASKPEPANPVETVASAEEPRKPLVPREQKDEPRSTPAPVAPAMDRKLSDAFSAAKKDAPKKEAPAPAAPRDGFTVQVAASQSKDEAEGVLQKLRGSGLRPYVMDVELPGKGHWYRVRLGSFKGRDDAEKYARDLKRETGLTAFVTAAAK
jgi:DedD protein